MNKTINELKNFNIMYNKVIEQLEDKIYYHNNYIEVLSWTEFML